MNVINLLVRRGFLIDKKNGAFYLSDNSHSMDRAYLSKLLVKYDLGFIANFDQVIITNDSVAAINKLKEIFLPVEMGTVGVGTCSQWRSWTYHVAKRDHADKLPVSWLEANIAAYIKALSASGIYTSGCCDGNHPRCYKLFIDFDGPVYCEYHKCLWEHLLNPLFRLNWDDSYRFIDLTENRQSQYNELFRASQYIYNHRWRFIELRKDSASWMTKKTLKHMRSNEIKERFLSNVITGLRTWS